MPETRPTVSKDSKSTEGMVAVSETGSPLVFTLVCKNGMPVVVDGRPGSRTVFIEIAARVGSRDEPRGLAGMSHLLEHLLFKEGHAPTGKRNPAFSALRAVGSVINASTDFELTEYHADVPADRFAEAWDALVSLVTGTAFNEQDVERERRVVLQEVAMGKTDPLAIVAYSVLRRLFPDDPIGQPVIGFRRTLHRIRHEDLDHYYRRFYAPSNMFAVIVGDVDPEMAASHALETIGALPAGSGVHPPYPLPTPRPDRLYRFRTLVKQSYLLAGSLTGGENATDAVALDLLASVLGGSRSSRLHRRLIDEEALTDQVLAVNFSVSNTGAFGAGLAVDPRKTDRARRILLEELMRMARETVSKDELETARTLLRGRLALEFETNEGIAGFRSQRMLRGRPVSRDEFLAEADALAPEDLLRAAQRHWGESGPIEIQVLPARGIGKLIAAVKYLLFRRL